MRGSRAEKWWVQQYAAAVMIGRVGPNVQLSALVKDEEGQR